MTLYDMECTKGEIYFNNQGSREPVTAKVFKYRNASTIKFHACRHKGKPSG